MFPKGSAVRRTVTAAWVSAILAGVAFVSFGGSAAQAQPERVSVGDEYSGDLRSKLAWTDSNCNGCHTPSKTFSHPVNKTVKMQVPSSLPLENGRMTCVTCHDDSSSQLHALARTTHDPMLRNDHSGPALCTQCHDRSFTKASDAHAMANTRAHGHWETKGAPVASQPVGSSRGHVDAESQSCLECHDGSMGSAVGGHQGGDLFQFGANQEHPIGMLFRQGKGRDAAPLKPYQALDKRIRLYDGSVGCGSCHSIYSQEKDLLVMSNQRSALCLSCHDY